MNAAQWVVALSPCTFAVLHAARLLSVRLHRLHTCHVCCSPRLRGCTTDCTTV